MTDPPAGPMSDALDPQRDPRLAPVFQLARACAYEAGHAHQVTRIALRLFDELTELHGLGEEDRFRLAAAGLLHDIGWVEGQKGHHKTALRYIITSAGLPWDRRHRRIIGCIARYHRKSLPKISHEHFGALDEADRQIVVKLAALLRLADGMDRTHTNIVREVGCATTDGGVMVRVETNGRAAAERAVAQKKSDLFERVYQHPIRLEWNTTIT